MVNLITEILVALAGERVQIPVRFLDHQVHIERNGRDLAESIAIGTQSSGPGRNVRPSRRRESGAPPCRRPRSGSSESQPQNRWRDANRHRLTSREIGSPGAIWKPACGF